MGTVFMVKVKIVQLDLCIFQKLSNLTLGGDFSLCTNLLKYMEVFCSENYPQNTVFLEKKYLALMLQVSSAPNTGARRWKHVIQFKGISPNSF